MSQLHNYVNCGIIFIVTMLNQKSGIHGGKTHDEKGNNKAVININTGLYNSNTDTHRM